MLIRFNTKDAADYRRFLASAVASRQSLRASSLFAMEEV